LDEINNLPNPLKIQLSFIRKVAVLNYKKENKLIKLSKEKIAELYYKGLPKYISGEEIRDEIDSKSELDKQKLFFLATFWLKLKLERERIVQRELP